MDQAEQFRVLALIVGAGLIGGFMVARNTRGLRALIAWSLWLALPFVVLGFILAMQIDPSWTQQQTSYNLGFGFVLISIIIAVPWLPANLVGGLVGLFFRKPVPVAVPFSTPDWSDPVPDSGLPDWSKADDPSLSLGEIGDMMYGAAELAGIDPARLPHVGPIAGGEGEFLDRDKFDYIYMGLERGQPMFDHRSVVADELLYRVFVDQAFMLASNRLAEKRKAGLRFPDSEYADRLAAEQAAILGDIDPAWERQFVHERALRAGG